VVFPRTFCGSACGGRLAPNASLWGRALSGGDELEGPQLMRISLGRAHPDPRKTAVLNRLWQWCSMRIHQRCEGDPLCRLLRREVTRVGREFEARPYSDLQEPAETLSFSALVEGVEIYFSAEAFVLKQNGDLGFCIDASAKGANAFWQPSYQFCKWPDGSVYH
jgi:hypothetical protein